MLNAVSLNVSPLTSACNIFYGSELCFRARCVRLLRKSIFKVIFASAAAISSFLYQGRRREIFLFLIVRPPVGLLSIVRDVEEVCQGTCKMHLTR